MENLIILHIYGKISRFMQPFRDLYHKRKAKRNRNTDPTIVCNNCTGGVILHDLGLRFNTPTINLTICGDDSFLYFVENFECFKSVEVRSRVIPQSSLSGGGEFSLNDKDVEIIFNHYPTFESGKQKWEERYKRCDFENLYIIYEYPDVTEEFAERFSKLKCWNKAIISRKNSRLEAKYDFFMDSVSTKNGNQVRFSTISIYSQ